VYAGEKLQRMTGTTRNLECSSERNRLQIIAGNEVVTFDLPAVESVEMNERPPGFTLACGSLKQVPVAVEYAPPRSVMETSTGIVRRLVF
jgi:hypothetical protein